MRELKFRVWSEEDREYRTDLNVFRLVEGKIFCTSPSYSLEGDRFDVEQYTGLKDKNDKEIYEGDIVGFKWRTKRLYVVTYRRYDASFILENDEWEETIHLSLDKDDFEVFGNIHENHDLLGDTNVTNKGEE